MQENILSEGISYYNRKNYTQALTYFLSLPEDCGANSIDLAYYLGLCYSKLKRYDDALLYLEQVVTASVDEEADAERVLQCRYLLAVIYCLSGRKKLADFELNKLLETGYRPSSVYASLAYIAWEQGKDELAVEYYRKALAEDEENPTALNGLGYVLACMETELTTALSCCKKALDLNPDSAACLDSLAWVYFKMGLYSEAKTFLERAIQKDAGNEIILDHISQLMEAEE